MAFGDKLKALYAGASSAAREGFDAAMSSARAAGEAVQKTTQAVAAKVTAAAKWSADTAAAVGGEGINAAMAASAITVANMPGYRLYAKAMTGFSGDSGVVEKCPDKTVVFSGNYRKALIGSEVKGANSVALRGAMEALLKPDPQNVDHHLQTIANERGRPVEQVKAEYQVFLEKKRDAELVAEHSNGKLEPTPPLSAWHDDFMGSTWQLRYGKVVGDYMGIDPVFGSMLNPTGGLVGPGNKAVDPRNMLMPESVGYHGAYHDAMGYLYNYHGGKGPEYSPGYNYMKSPVGLDTSNPLAGQFTGIAEFSTHVNAR